MTLTLLQIAALVLMGAYFYCSVVERRHRNQQSWDSLVARLRPGWNARELIDEPVQGRRLHLTLYGKLKHIHGARGLWAIYANAGVLLEMADYAARNSCALDPELLTFMRKEAMETRLLVLEVLGKYAVSAVSDGVRINVLRAESAYAEMTLRITEVLEANAPEALPGFICAM